MFDRSKNVLTRGPKLQLNLIPGEGRILFIGDTVCPLGEVDFGVSICNIKILTAKIILRSNYKRRFSIFLALPMRKWHFCAQKSEKGTK
jgi:hypothetical protein